MAVSAAPAVASRLETPAARGLRVVKVGVLGLGNVGQAIVRNAAAAAPALRERGIALAIEGALVRDPAKPRRCPKVARVTSNVEAFLRGRYDVVIDALAGREPANSIVGRLLGKGIPVVSANKALIAAEGRRLRRVAARGNTSLHVEASALAGVPFIGTLERRPLAAQITRFVGILNGTSNFILYAVGSGTPIASAIADAQRLGYAEPDPAADLSGRDALDKLIVLAETFFGLSVPASAVTVEGIEHLTPADLAEARERGGEIKPVVYAAREGDDLAAYVGPAWIEHRHPLASIAGRDNAIVIEGRHIDRLVFAGPGAGPDITAATLIDDAIEAIDAPPAVERRSVRPRVIAPRFEQVGKWRALRA